MKEISENKFCAVQKRDFVNVLYGKYRKRCNLLSIEHINNSAYLFSLSDRCLQFVFQTYLILQTVIILQKDLLLLLLFSSIDPPSDVNAAIRQKIICMGSNLRDAVFYRDIRQIRLLPETAIMKIVFAVIQKF